MPKVYVSVVAAILCMYIGTSRDAHLFGFGTIAGYCIMGGHPTLQQATHHFAVVSHKVQQLEMCQLVYNCLGMCSVVSMHR